MSLYHLIVYTPLSHTDTMRAALAKAGAGKIGHYDSCSFSVQGTGRFRGDRNSNPAVGQPGTIEEVQEERIEVVVTEDRLKEVLTAVTKAHPYEEPAIHVLPLLDYKEFI